ncbi:hypothetical protein N7466_003743 [Penicillium verhagenii]|uniref:uncharacterized protein n=1 Tax=Penicillium verhagenii TaxID=1562060 RepID=UPI002545426F|nr:uncharacterized protein N7466_003743 [Penicillium verhagenii]KAJ5934196.1 hypothetical protein N7466_003743 [Penicillium verhagenii]
MSGILGNAITPCPSRSRLFGYSSGDHSGSDTFDSLIDGDTDGDATGQVDFTTEICIPTMTGVRPRRAARAGSGFQIHDEGAEKLPRPAEKRQRPNEMTRLSSDRKSSLLSQPAQRFRTKVDFAPNQSHDAKQEAETQPQPERRVSNLKTQPPRGTGPVPKDTAQRRLDTGLKRSIRRDTVYIPPDDATVPSVFMGLFSPLKKQGLPQIRDDTQANTLEARIADRQARKSLTVSSRKPPLQPSAKIRQEAAFRVDVAGKNGGKENIPPGAMFDLDKKTSAQSKPPLNPRTTIIPASKTRPITRINNTVPVAPKPPLPKRGMLGEKQNNTKSSALHGSQSRMVAPRRPLQSASLNARVSALSDRRGLSGSTCGPRAQHASVQLKDLNHNYPKLTEDIKKPALYEDDWLSHQEAVITQLVNALFECSNGDSNLPDQSYLRLELLELYHTEFFIQLHKRLQASLSCGTLSIPKHALVRAGRLRQDLGLRRKFLDIWIQSYDHNALAAAVETVIGRNISKSHEFYQHGTESDHNAKSTKAMTRKLENFLHTFLLRNEDLDQPLLCASEVLAEFQAKAYRRTVLRCILLVVLLDQAKQSLGSTVPRQLFVPSSSFKSSESVLQALIRVVLPSCGDILKPLSHLGCRLSYKQHQLSEYHYQMDNIAVDLRDGVRLTKIVELLFITSSQARRDSGDQTEVTLNTGEALSLLGDHADVPLSKHLKYPCVSRTAKVFNVHLALSALQSIRGSNEIVDKIRAEDIVDGYREKTIALLWGLVGKRGLTRLVDWDDISKEISRLKRKALLQLGPDQVNCETWFTGEQLDDTDQHEHLLQHWAGLLAGLKGLQMNNMSTSFADGRIYESIVDEYEPYITGTHATVRSETSGRSAFMYLEKRLGLLGCSSQFAHIISPSSASHTLNRDFTLGALAFLCSRLLSGSKRARAATVLQRAWRVHLEDRHYLRRTIAKTLASQCAAVVQARNQLLWANKVIASWWRQIKARKQASAARSQSLPKPVGRPLGRS